MFDLDFDDDTSPEAADQMIGIHWPSAEPAVAVPSLVAVPVEVDATPSQRGADVAHASAVRAISEMGRP